MIENIMLEMAEVNNGDAKRISHALKVYAHAKCIAGCAQLDAQTQRVVETAAVLHDIAIAHCERNYGSCGGKLQEQHGPGIARPILEKHTSDTALIDRVCFLIAHHHTYDDIQGIDYQILVEADFLVNGEEGNISMQAFWSAHENLFKTPTGKALASAMFGDAPR